MAAGRGDLERALGALLSLDVAQVRRRPRRAARSPGSGRDEHLRALEMVGELDQRARREDLDVAPAQAASGPQAAGQISPWPRALAATAAGSTPATAVIEPSSASSPSTVKPLERVGRDRADRRHHAERDRQVVVAALLRQVGGREVDGDAARPAARGPRRSAPRAPARATSATALSARPTMVKAGSAGRDLHLHVDRPRLDALERDRRDPHDHTTEPHRILA